MADFHQNAKQILHGKQHIADCIDAETAAMIVARLNDLPATHISGESLKLHPEFIALREDRDQFERRALLAEQGAADQIAAYLDAQADKRPRRRQFTQGIRFAAQEIRARMWEPDEPAPGTMMAAASTVRFGAVRNVIGNAQGEGWDDAMALHPRHRL